MSVREWVEDRRVYWLEVIRIFLGLALMGQGYAFTHRATQLFERVQATGVNMGQGMLAHYVIIAHIGGGLLLALGLATRLAAIIQIPVLFGAVFLVDLKLGIFSYDFELAALVLFLLVVYAIIGGGRWSIDWMMAHPRKYVPPRALKT